MSDQINQSGQKVVIDKPHQPYGQHVDIIQPVGGVCADKIRIGPSGQVLTHELSLKGGKTIDVKR
jgi:hypothetical protein